MKAVILAGGGGTRLWPLSTPEIPKQFQKLVSGKTMLEETIIRLDFLKNEDIFIAINQKHLKLTRQICPKIPARNIIIEPALRDTASCIGLAAAIIEKNFPGECMAVIYADHLIKNKKEFQKSLKIAAQIATKEKTLNIIEVQAREPDTNYGYVKLGKKIGRENGTEIFILDSFIEKPDLKIAKKFLKSGKYLWNTGIYVWRSDVLLEKYHTHQAKTFNFLNKIVKSSGAKNLREIIQKNYAKLPRISIDYAIMEKVDPREVRIIKSKLDWSDIGNWEAVYKEIGTKKEENISRGNVTMENCSKCLIYGDTGEKIIAIGLKNLVVINTKDGLLISERSQSKKVKDLNSW